MLVQRSEVQRFPRRPGRACARMQRQCRSIEAALELVRHWPGTESRRVRWAKVHARVAACAAWWTLEQLSRSELITPAGFDGLNVAPLLGDIRALQTRAVQLVIAGSRTLQERAAGLRPDRLVYSQSETQGNPPFTRTAPG
jgi:hypothetical protein